MLKEAFLIRRSDRFEERVEVVHYIPLLTAAEYRLLLENAGFAARGYSSYEEQPEDGRSHILCFVVQSVSQEGQN